jgi:hypothetical protein
MRRTEPEAAVGNHLHASEHVLDEAEGPQELLIGGLPHGP